MTLNNVSPVALTLPQPGTAQIDSNFAVWITNEGAGTVTITPNVSVIDGHANLDLHTNQGVIVFTDGTDYFTVRGIAGVSSGNAVFSHYTDAGTSETAETDLYSDTIAGLCLELRYVCALRLGTTEIMQTSLFSRLTPRGFTARR